MQLLAAVCIARGRPGVVVAVTLELVGLATPWLIPPEHTVLRSLLSLSALVGLLRGVDLLGMRDRPLGARLFHSFGIIDTTQIARARPAMDARLLVRAAVNGALLAASAWICFGLGPGLEGVARILARWGAGAVVIYCNTDLAFALLTVFYRAIGIVPGDLHRAPIVARSVREFWGRRWNRVVNLWLFARIFRPLARRRRPRLGVSAAFLASALLHAYFIGVSLDWTMTLWMFGYFVLQGVFVFMELALRRWSFWPRVSRTWTVVVMVCTAPLFVEPFVRLFDGVAI